MNKLLSITQIEENPKNHRTKYVGIEKLADSIATYGLLQNLVVFEYEPEKYQVRVGNRRRFAILMLVEQKRWPPDRLVECRVLSTFGNLESLVENIERENPPAWDIAAEFNRLYESGLDQRQIGMKFGKHQTMISDYLAVHRGLGQKAKRALINILPQQITFSQILRLAKCIDPQTDEPLEDVQLDMLAEFLGKTKKGPKKAKRMNQTFDILRRFEYLSQATVPLHAQPYVTAIVEYLKGERKRLRFKNG